MNTLTGEDVKETITKSFVKFGMENKKNQIEALSNDLNRLNISNKDIKAIFKIHNSIGKKQPHMFDVINIFYKISKYLLSESRKDVERVIYKDEWDIGSYVFIRGLFLDGVQDGN